MTKDTKKKLSCNETRQLDWTIDNVKPNTDMFLGCNVLTGENGTHYNASHAGSDYACLDETGSPGYFTYKQYESSIALPQIRLQNVKDVYDLRGVKVRTVDQSIKNLPSGFYLVGDRKIFVK